MSEHWRRLRLRARHPQLTDAVAAGRARPRTTGRDVPTHRAAQPARVPTAVLALAVALSGCGGDAAERIDDDVAPSAETAPPPSPLDACAIISAAQVDEILGEAPGDPIVGMNQPGDDRLAQVSQCTWPAQDSERVLSVLIRRTPTDQNTPAAIEQVRETLRTAGLTLEDADGPGDVTFWTGTELHVFRGQREYVIVGLTGFDDRAAALAGARRAAELILENL